MKIIYCNHSVYNPGGMERVMLNKIRWMVERLGWEVMIVTTDQKGRPPFYPVPEGVRMVDLGINYSDDNCLGTLRKVMGYLRRRRVHRRRLTELLMQERADVVVSLFPSESSFLPDIQDDYNRKGLLSEKGERKQAFYTYRDWSYRADSKSEE